MKNSRIVTAVILLTGAGLMALGLTRGELCLECVGIG